MSASYALASDWFENYVGLINKQKTTKALRTIYNQLTKNGIEVFKIDDYQVVIEAHYNFSCLYVSLWFEPQDFSQRKCLKNLQITK